MSKYLRIYEALCPDDVLTSDDPRRSAILAEMRAVISARTEAEAVKVIEWWQPWPDRKHRSAEDFVREARRLAAEGKAR